MRAQPIFFSLCRRKKKQERKLIPKKKKNESKDRKEMARGRLPGEKVDRLRCQNAEQKRATWARGS